LGKITCNPEDDSHFLIIYSYSIKSVRAQSRNDEAAILVDLGPKGISTFEEESTLFNSINERLSEAFVELYAPVSYDTPVDREKMKATLDKIIFENIVSFFEGGKDENT